jgi:glycosyltransferase involved in cell wall biosynthesis
MTAAALLVTNTGHPELDHLAAQAARRGMLAGYIRPWAYDGAPVAHLPRRLNGLLRKRARPELADLERVEFAATVADVAATLAARARIGPVQASAERRRRAEVDRRGVRRLTRAPVPTAVCANFGGAERTFRYARDHDIRTVLSYPTIHHDSAERLGRAIALAEPALAATLDFVGLSRSLRERLSREIALADRILVASTFAAETFVEAGVPRERLVVAAFGSSTGQTPPVLPTGAGTAGPLRVGFCGQVGARKGFHLLLRALREMEPDTAQLTVAGRFVGPPDVWSSFGIDFAYAGNLDRDGLARFYSSIDVLVLPTYFEGLPLGVLDALSYGVPAIVTDRGPGDAVRDGVEGLVVPAGDHHAVTEALTRLAGNRELLRALARAAARRADHFTWDRYAETALAALA